MATRQDASTGKIVKEQAAPTDSGTMHVKIYSPFQTYFDDDARSISGVNGTGPFDILPRHYNFLSLLVPCVLTVRGLSGDRSFKITRGMMHVKTNQVIVFLDI